MARKRSRKGKGENQKSPETQIQEEGKVTTMTSRVRDMTPAQREKAFEDFLKRQDTNKGRNVAKRKAMADLKLRYADEYNASVAQYAAEEGVTMPSASSSDEDDE